jgi:hypothetical protein
MTKNSRSNSGEQEKEPKKQGKFNETSRGYGTSRSSKGKRIKKNKKASASGSFLFQSYFKKTAII